MIINPHAGRDAAKDIEAFRTLYNAGAFLVPCAKDKRPIVKLKDPHTGEWNRPDIESIVNHRAKGGFVGYYGPGLQGLFVLDFDPMLDEWLDAVSDAIGAPPLAVWHSSGKLKPAKDGKPEGYGGHAVWKAKPEMGTKTRKFSYVTDGIPVGEIFSNDPGFYFIVYNPTALVDAMESDPIECIDPANVPPASRPASQGGGANYTDDWVPDENSRHDSTVSAVASAAFQFDRRERFAAELDNIRTKFMRSLQREEQNGRDVKSEWNRIEAHGWTQWDKDRAKEVEQRRAEDGKASENDPEGIQHALTNARAPATRRAILEISKKTGEKAKPEIPMVKAIKSIADDLGLPDENALHEVECLLAAGQAMSVSETIIVETRGRYINEWRPADRVKMHLGDFPLASKFVTGLYKTKAEAEHAIKVAGGVALQAGFKCQTSDDVMTALRATGVNVIWSELDTAIMLTHNAHKEWRKGKKCSPPEFQPIMQLQKGIIRSVLSTKKCDHPSQKDEKGKPVVMWKAQQIMTTEMNASAFMSKMMGQVGSEIPRIDFTIELTKWVMQQRDAMSESQRAECVDLASNWLLRIPQVRVIDAERNAPLAQTASKIVYTAFFHRRFQFMGEYIKPYSQRYVPVFGGEKRVGKTTIAKFMFPTTGVFEQRIENNFAWSNDDNDMKRHVSGKLVVINDEMAGIKTAKVDKVKAFITWSDGDYHEKFKNYEAMVRSDVMVATANQSNDIPSDAALRDRFIFINMEAAPGYSDKERHDGIKKWFKDHHTQLLVGGLIMAEQDIDLNPPSSIEELRADSIVALDASNNNFNDAIMEIIESGLSSKEGPNGPIVSVCLVALHAGLLKYQRDVYANEGTDQEQMRFRQGSIIRPSDAGYDIDFEWSDDVQDAFKVRRNERNQTGSITQIKDAIKNLHGDDALKVRFDEPSVEGRKRGKFQGFEVMSGRLSKHWGSQ